MSTTVPVNLGRTEHGHDLRIDLAEPWHTAIQGATRSGKSVLTYGLLGQVAGRPDVVVAGLDPTGILLNPLVYAPQPGWRWLGPTEVDGARTVVLALVAEMERRIALLKDRFLDKFEDFDAAFPLILVVFEELPGVLEAAEEDDAAQGRKPADRVKPRIHAGLGRLVREGAKAGIRCVVLSQRMDASTVGGAARDQLGLRITLRQESSDGVRMLHEGQVSPDDMPKFARFPPGQGFFQHPVHGTGLFRADATDYRSYVRRVMGGRSPY